MSELFFFMSDGPESPLKKIPASAHGPLTLPSGKGGISLCKAYTCATGITPFFTAPWADPGIFYRWGGGGGSGPSGILTILFQGSRGGPTFSGGGGGNFF